MTKLFIVVFRDEEVKTFTKYYAALDYVAFYGNSAYEIHEVNYE